jgi:hypothetical protein
LVVRAQIFGYFPSEEFLEGPDFQSPFILIRGVFSQDLLALLNDSFGVGEHGELLLGFGNRLFLSELRGNGLSRWSVVRVRGVFFRFFLVLAQLKTVHREGVVFLCSEHCE